jgi:hypothetical protein
VKGGEGRRCKGRRGEKRTEQNRKGKWKRREEDDGEKSV